VRARRAPFEPAAGSFPLPEASARRSKRAAAVRDTLHRDGACRCAASPCLLRVAPSWRHALTGFERLLQSEAPHPAVSPASMTRTANARTRINRPA